MKRLSPWQRAGLAAILLGIAALYLWRADFLQRIETDVSSILPQDDALEARLARDIVNRQQARSAYLVLELPIQAPSEEAADWLEGRLAAMPEIERVVPLGGDTPLVSTCWSEKDRIALLFPKWLAEQRREFEADGNPEEDFPSWTATRAAARLDAFLQSPESLQLADGPLFDPLRLVIDALEKLAPMQPDPENDQPNIRPYWLELSGTGLNQDFQYAYLDKMRALEAEVAENWPGAALEHGGLVVLAAGSRERIQSDVYRINLISLAGVLAVAFAMLRRALPLLAAAPTILAATLGGATAASLAFDRISIIVVVIGSILIGTAIDYAMHMLLRDDAKTGVNSRKLLLLACLSTVAGFCALLLSSMELVRQIGVFVAGGLASAFVVALLLTPIRNDRPAERAPASSARWPFWCAAAVAATLVAIALPGLRWEDDIAKLEAAAPELVERDLALRARLGGPASATTIVSTGASFLDALENQAALLGASGAAAEDNFALSAILSTRAEAEQADANREEARATLDAFERALEDSGYDIALFADFFAAVRSSLEARSRSFAEAAEAKLAELSESLTGPAAFLLGSEAEFRWTTLTSPQSAEAFAEALRASPDSVSLSSKTFLSGYLAQARREMAQWGAIALAVVAVVILAGNGARLGAPTIAIPIAAAATAMAIASLALGPLDLFFLIGCFLGMALAFDYALFAVAYFRSGAPMPKSVWLSYGTTAAAFFALTQSAIPMARSLGLSVLLITTLTVLALALARPILTPRNA